MPKASTASEAWKKAWNLVVGLRGEEVYSRKAEARCQFLDICIWIDHEKKGRVPSGGGGAKFKREARLNSLPHPRIRCCGVPSAGEEGKTPSNVGVLGKSFWA